MAVSPTRSFAGAIAALVLFGSGVGAGYACAPQRATHAAPAPIAERTEPVSVEMTRASPTGAEQHVKQLALEARQQTAALPTHAASLAPREIAKRALASTVFLRGGNVYGAGVVLDAKGHVLTCDHVIDGLDHVVAYFDSDPVPVPVTIVARDHAADLALLKLQKPRPGSAAVTASIADVAMGDEVFAMGAPRKMTFSMSHGIVSYLGRSFDGTYYVQTDLAANSGSSGGPVLDDRGDVIGVSSFILRGSQGLTFAVPIDYAYQRFARQLGVARDAHRFDEWLQSRKAEPEIQQPG